MYVVDIGSAPYLFLSQRDKYMSYFSVLYSFFFEMRYLLSTFSRIFTFMEREVIPKILDTKEFYMCVRRVPSA